MSTFATGSRLTSVSRVGASTAPRRVTVCKAASKGEFMNGLDLAGSCMPTPEFDPFGFSVGKSDETLKRYREAEVTHGRVAMVAALGFVINEEVDGRSFTPFNGTITGPAINQFQQVPELLWLAIVFGIGVAELGRANIGWLDPQLGGSWTLREDYQPGDLGFDPLGLAPEDAEEFKLMQTRELNHGRLAMIAISAFVAEELKSGDEIFRKFAPDGILEALDPISIEQDFIDIIEDIGGLPESY